VYNPVSLMSKSRTHHRAPIISCIAKSEGGMVRSLVMDIAIKTQRLLVAGLFRRHPTTIICQTPDRRRECMGQTNVQSIFHRIVYMMESAAYQTTGTVGRPSLHAQPCHSSCTLYRSPQPLMIYCLLQKNHRTVLARYRQQQLCKE